MSTTTGVTQSNDNRQLGNTDRFSVRHFVRWFGFLSLCLALWEIDKAVVAILVVSVLFLPMLSIAWLAGTVQSASRGRWRSAASVFFGPAAAGVLMLAMSRVGLDPDRIHFLLVKYPHEIEVHASGSAGHVVRSWSWGLDAAPFSAGVAYTLKYDPTDRESSSAKVSDKSVRPMGDHFYIVKESEDGSPL
ncbi:hypothetical protein NX905_21420 [Burkholderia thailandensis]|uniref:hypothetical protein n=1 Tax=Burkholderia thailandensis TaxID=57975 RepID=UPI00217CE27A|nr:hypothetical protein [Burkholderia thailandensis]MCS6496808.1 hypothetical protein [Burkholderia thailandensis]